MFEALTRKSKVSEYLFAKMNNIKNGGLKHKVYAEIGYCGSQKGNNIQVFSATAGRPVCVLAQGNKEMPIGLVLLEVNDSLIERIDVCSVVPHPLSAQRTGEYPE